MISAVLDHLWQSTLFAAGAGLVTLFLQGNAARVRFWVWFAASVKFLLPFSALAALGTRLLPPPAAPLPVLTGLAPVAEPLLAPLATAHAFAVAAPTAAAFDWTGVLLAVWGLGTLAIAARWLTRWRRLRATLSQAGAVTAIGGISVRRAPASLEPGLFGIWRPMILLPQDIDAKLSPAELDAVLAHEACHRDHRDNLLAAVHMVVEALFWFHPLVWWLGARLNHERERACDEAVLAAGQAPEVYAESILKVCKLYVHSPLACVAGISGAGLKERIERIVVNAVTVPLGAARKLLLTALAGAALVVPLSASLVMAPLVQAAAQSRDRPAMTAQGVAQLQAEQAQPRKLVAFDAKDFDKFVGKYQLGSVAVFTVTRDGGHYFTQLTGQGPVEIFPESQTKFFATVVAAQISFDSDAAGRVTGLVLHQGGMEQHAPRISAEAAKALEDARIARIKGNKPSPGTEASLRRYIDSLEKGAPNYEEMTPALANVVRAQLPGILAQIAQLGRLQSLTFKRVDTSGMDVYDVVFEHGHVIWMIGPLTADGKVDRRGFRQVD
jgi:beta-lactamase regulating signal transducer with metallopeptidase domain